MLLICLGLTFKDNLWKLQPLFDPLLSGYPKAPYSLWPYRPSKNHLARNMQILQIFSNKPFKILHLSRKFLSKNEVFSQIIKNLARKCTCKIIVLQYFIKTAYILRENNLAFFLAGSLQDFYILQEKLYFQCQICKIRAKFNENLARFVRIILARHEYLLKGFSAAKQIANTCLNGYKYSLMMLSQVEYLQLVYSYFYGKQLVNATTKYCYCIMYF